jgi:signal transduction histidine kinase
MSSTSTWSGPESYADDGYPASLLKYLLQQMMVQFAAQGACLALLDESVGQMRIQAHIRQRDLHASIAPHAPLTPPGTGPGSMRRRMTVHLEHDGVAPPTRRQRSSLPSLDDLEDVMPQLCSLFAVDSTYPKGQDVIGFAWQKNDAFIINSHEEYLEIFHKGRVDAIQADITPSSYLIIPIEEPILLAEMHGQRQHGSLLGVMVLYQVTSGIGAGFQPRQRQEALQAVERVALYLQNDRLQRSQHRTWEYLQLLQEISTAFPTTVSLADLVEKMYRFIKQVVNASSIVLTLYDRDTERIYDIFAVSQDEQVLGLADQPTVATKEERPVWWQVTQQEKHTLQFSPSHDPEEAERYRELLVGAWGDQRRAEAFLLLPMKMFNRSVGSLRLSSQQVRAYGPEAVEVLETMVQIVTVGIENVKLYERDRQLLHEAKQREAQLAGINSALQSVSAVLNVGELLNSFVDSVADLVHVDLCVFFQLSQNKEELVAQALHGLSSATMQDDGSDLPAIAPPRNKAEHDELIRMIRLPFKDTFLEQMVNEGGFFYLESNQLDDLAQKCEEGGAIFLRETILQPSNPGRQMLVIPMTYQTELVGLLGVPTPKGVRFFRPKEVGTLLAICAQTTSAIRNANLFGEREEAYAKLEHMDKLKDEFIVTASHELRTPLSAIIGYTSLLRRQSARISPPQILRFATRIGGAAQQLLDLVSNMTVAAQMGTVDKKLELTIAPVQVLSAAEIAASMLSMSAEQKITNNVDPELWVNGDALYFRQIISNLLENASKYSPPESQITLSAEATKLINIQNLLPEDQIDHAAMVEQENMPIVLIRVQDQGEGILPEDESKIFEKFVRAPRSLTTPVRGSGLGLYICRRYVEAMGGRLWLEKSIPNKGSTFTFYLPRVESPIETGEYEAGEHKKS